VITPRDLKKISQAILDESVEIKWHGVSRFERGMNQELFNLMAKAGCVRLYMGLESTNERLLKLMDKGTTPQRIEKILSMCHKAKIAVEAGIFSGFPSETADEAEETYKFVLKNRQTITRADIGSFRLLKGSPIADNPENYGISLDDSPSKKWHHLDYSDFNSLELKKDALSPM
jgi:anaerobic magnesium-protoporphyrin IX monomethyl ester cyclase